MRFEDYMGAGPEIMPFGKHRGMPVRDCPRSYLAWCLENCDLRLRPTLRLAIVRELRSWLDEQGGPAPAGVRPDAAVPDVLSAVRGWYRRLSLRYHPDKGGSTAAMAAINEAYEQLRSDLRLG